MATTLYHPNHHQHNIAPKYIGQRRRFSHDHIKDYFNANPGEETSQQQNKNTTTDIDEYNETDEFSLYGINTYFNNYKHSSKSVYYKALNTARLRKASSVLHHIIVESAYENMADPEELLVPKNNTENARQQQQQQQQQDDTSNNLSTSSTGLGVGDPFDGSSDKSKNDSDCKDERFDNNNNNDNRSNDRVTHRDKKLYKLRKHNSDYDIVYLQIEQGLDVDNNTHDDTPLSFETPQRNRTASCEHENEIEGDFDKRTVTRSISKSESNLLNPTLISSTSCTRINKINKSSSHVDITSTQMYKDIYADSLRQYGFLLAKQLGSNHSPDQLRKMYQKGRKKAQERRDRANTLSMSASREQLDAIVSQQRERSSTSYSVENLHDSFSPQRRLSSQSNTSGSIPDLRAENKYTCSLTDISSVAMLEKHKKPTTTVIRRKKGTKLPRDPTKRMSAPQLGTVGNLSEIINSNIAECHRHNTLPLRKSSKSPATLSVLDISQQTTGHNSSSPDDSGTEMMHENVQSKRKLSDETVKRKNEAKARHEFRMSRLKSFEGVLSQASTWMKDVKAKSHDQNPCIDNKPEENPITETNNVDQFSQNKDSLVTEVKTINSSGTTPNGIRKDDLTEMLQQKAGIVSTDDIRALIQAEHYITDI